MPGASKRVDSASESAKQSPCLAAMVAKWHFVGTA
jgi:hypothetical protein